MNFTAPPRGTELFHRDLWSVRDLTALLAGFVSEILPQEIWITGEITSFKIRMGHAFFELSESGSEDAPAALRTGRAPAVSCAIWASKLLSFKTKYKELPLADGLKVKLRARCELRPDGGRLLLVVSELDPQFTMGGLALGKQELLRKLRAEGLYDANRQRRMPAFPLRIALLTAQGSRALTDFVDELRITGMAFRITLFDTLMQGERSAESVCAALADAQAAEPSFDCIVLTRGGGSRLDLRWFDEPAIAFAIARCRLPVLTAIGHTEDSSVADEVAFKAEKTPTGAARYLAERAGTGLEDLRLRLERVAGTVRRRVDGEKVKVARTEERLAHSVRRRFKTEHDKLASLRRTLELLAATMRAPLRQGYALLRDAEGRILGFPHLQAEAGKALALPATIELGDASGTRSLLIKATLHAVNAPGASVSEPIAHTEPPP